MIRKALSSRPVTLLVVALVALFGSPGSATVSANADESGSGEGNVAPQQAGEDGIEEEEVPPGLDQSVIKKVIDSHMPAIKYCYNKELRKNAGLSGTVVTRFTVGPKGKVTQAEVNRSTLNNKNVETCMIDEIKSWVFPEPNKGVEVLVNYPFKFRSSSSSG